MGSRNVMLVPFRSWVPTWWLSSSKCRPDNLCPQQEKKANEQTKPERKLSLSRQEFGTKIWDVRRTWPSFISHSKICSTSNGCRYIANHKFTSLWGDFKLQPYRAFPMFYSVILLITNNTFRQHNTKQKHRREQKGMKRNGLNPLRMPIKWEPITKTRYQTKKRAEEPNAESWVQTRSWHFSIDSTSHEQKAQIFHVYHTWLMAWAFQACWGRGSLAFLWTGFGVILSISWRITCVCSLIVLSAYFLPLESQKSGSLCSFHPGSVLFSPSWQNFCQDGWWDTWTIGSVSLANGCPATPLILLPKHYLNRLGSL